MFSWRSCQPEGREGGPTVDGPPMFMRTTAGDRIQGRIGGRATSEEVVSPRRLGKPCRPTVKAAETHPSVCTDEG